MTFRRKAGRSEELRPYLRVLGGYPLQRRKNLRIELCFQRTDARSFSEFGQLRELVNPNFSASTDVGADALKRSIPMFKPSRPLMARQGPRCPLTGDDGRISKHSILVLTILLFEDPPTAWRPLGIECLPAVHPLRSYTHAIQSRFR